MTPNPPDLNNAPLGKRSDTPAHYDPSLLFPMPRSMARDALALGPTLPFMGADFWTGYELSWLNAKGKPQVGILQVSVPCETPFIIESKSFKLYLNSLNNHRVPNVDALTNLISNDVNPALWGDTSPSGQALVKIITPEAFEAAKITTLPGLSIDRLDIEIDHPAYDPSLSHVHTDEGVVEETLTSNLLRALCRVTGQPDWGSVQITYSGPQIDQAGLLQYIVSFRNHNEFHEQCVERIFMDIWTRCQPTQLAVYARYTRRGGLDINPWRTSAPGKLPPNVRTARQ